MPDHPVDVILGRPTGTSVTLSVLFYSDVRAYVTYGTGSGDLARRSEVRTFQKGAPQEIVLDRLRPDTQYYYQIRDADCDAPLWPASGRGRFHTQRRCGGAFTFTVTADSHLDGNTQPELYKKTVEGASADAPDFHIDLGDTFMVDKHPGRDSAARQYLAQRYYLGLIGEAAPVFLVLGNHDGEDGKLQKNGADSLAVWSNTMRRRYFPNPVPDGFYTGDTARDRFCGPLADYYAWQWGDALFVVLDPYWFTRPGGGDDNWSATLGERQYLWLRETLESSKARFKFVFIHRLVGGLDGQGRGGAEASGLYEWGGHEKDGTDTFAANRPGWGKPIHDLLVAAGVTIVFHGHDHFFARQHRDGIVYQLVPQPGHRNSRTHQAGSYGYAAGDFLPGSGFLRVRVRPEGVEVAYIRSATLDMAGRGVRNADPAFVYECPADKAKTAGPSGG